MISKEDWDEFLDTKKEHALLIIGDLVSDYMYYNRKEDEDLSRDDLDKLIKSGDLTADEIIEQFAKEIRRVIK